jgi:hypothetical protein
MDSTMAEIDRWFFGEYVAKWVSIAASGTDHPGGILEHWGVPMHAASVHVTRWLLTPEDVIGFLTANQAPLKAAGYTHTAVVDRAITVYNRDAASVDAIWSRREASGSEIERVAVHFEIHRTDGEWRVIGLASSATSAGSLADVWRRG